MNYSLIDASGLLLAVLLCGVVIAAPGYALARAFRVTGRRGEIDATTGAMIGLATLPALDSLLVRFLGLDAALSVSLGLAFAGLGLAWRSGAPRRPSWLVLSLSAFWLILVLVEWIDVDVAGKLYQPLTIFDSVKHAATTQAIHDSGAPPRDAFFLRPELSSYYYFFYTPAALVMRLSGGLVDAKAAVGGLVFWTGLGCWALVRATLDRLGVTIPAGRRSWLTAAVMAAGGLDILAVLTFVWSRHYWLANPLQWNEQVGAWLVDLLWVPHHVTALIAGMIGCMALSDTMDLRPSPSDAKRAVILAALGFAASLGLSVWVTLGVAVTAAIWAVALLLERRWRVVGLIVMAGALALVLAVPQLLDLKAGRAPGGGLPIALMVREFTPVELLLPRDVVQVLVELVAIPLNYAFEFGVLALGTFVYWRQERTRPRHADEFARVLAIAAVTGLALGGVLKSTIFNNDLGWRVTLLPLLGGTVWTIVAINRLLDAAAARTPLRAVMAVPAVGALFVVGWVTTIYGAVMMRAYPFVTVNPSARFMSADPATERSLRDAYGWATTHLPITAVLQQNPMKRRAFAFAVYGRNPTGVADTFASLYGADPAAVDARLAQLGPIFQTNLPLSQIGIRATAHGIDEIVVTKADPVWAQPESFVWRVKPIYASARVRIIPVVTIEAAR